MKGLSGMTIGTAERLRFIYAGKRKAQKNENDKNRLQSILLCIHSPDQYDKYNRKGDREIRDERVFLFNHSNTLFLNHPFF